MRILSLLTTLLLSFSLQAQTVVDIIVDSENHDTLEAAVIAAGLADDLSGEGPFTVFAPTDSAFSLLPAGLLDTLLADPTGSLADILLYHVANDSVTSGMLVDSMVIPTLNGKEALVTIDSSGTVFINDARVETADLIATNGVVHVIDLVLTPPEVTVVDVIANSAIHETLETAIAAASLTETLAGEGPFTVFAPTDAAFDSLPDGALESLLMDPQGALANVLLYHVIGDTVYSTAISDALSINTLLGESVLFTVSGTDVFINNALISTTDIIADNGVVHVIEGVLLPPEEEDSTVVDIIVNSPDHTVLEAAVLAAELDDDLAAAGPFTVFAPTDDAFNALPDGSLDALLMDPSGALADILLYHVAEGAALSSQLSDSMMIMTLGGDEILVSIRDTGVFINDAEVIIADIEADNGVVHVIDAVLTPPASGPATVVDVIVGSEIHNTLETAVIEANLVETLSGAGPFTVFAPTDDAFAALPEGLLDTLLADPSGVLTNILLYHVAEAAVLSGQLSDSMMIMTLGGDEILVSIRDTGVFINDAEVILADIEADNGVVHVIDAVLTPPAARPATVVDVIVGSEIHNTLETAVIEANLVETLSGEGPFTVFAPTDEAFAALPEGLLDTLLADPSGALTNILLYHVLEGAVLSGSLVDGTSATTILGDDVQIAVTDTGVFINDAQVIMADIETDNGVVHVIDAVLVPDSTTTSIDVVDAMKHDISVFPNPASDFVQIRWDENRYGSLNVDLIDMLGRTVRRWEKVESLQSLSIHDLQSSQYILRLEASDRIFQQMLILK